MMPNCFGEFGIAFVELGAWVMNPNALLLTGFCHAPEDVSCLFSFRRECSHPSELIKMEQECDLDLAAGFRRSS